MSGITRSNLCLYGRFRLFRRAEVIFAVRLARQVCALPAQTCAPFALKRTGKLSHSPDKKANLSENSNRFAFGGESDITRSHLCLYMRYRLFKSAEAKLVFRSARQVCALPAQTCAPFALKRTGKLSHSPDKKANLSESSNRFAFGGESGIRTHDTLWRYTRFPIVLLRPSRTSLLNDFL